MENIEITGKNRNPAYQETKRHSDTMFAFNIYPCTIPADFAFVPLHWQDSVEIIYVKRGSGIVQVDFETMEANAGDIFFVMPGHLHGLRELRNIRMEYENIIFDMNFLGSDSVDLCSQKYLQPLLSGKLCLPVRIDAQHPLHSRTSACLDAADHLCALRPKGYELGIKGQLMLLFSGLLAECSDSKQYGNRKADDRDMQKLKTILSRIEKDYDQKLTVQDMADECGYSASHFMRWFKEITGSGFYAYLIEYRLEKAAQSLRSGCGTILETAEHTGFENLSNFNRLFKKRFGMTPGQFRRQLF